MTIHLEESATATPSRGRFGSPALVGVVDASAAAVLYSIGWDRAFSFDASRTVAQFVATDSTGDVFGQDRFNNHPLMSLLEHLVFSATGSQDERVLRVLPIVFGAAAVGLVGAAVGRRFGPVAGHVSGATLAVNAMAMRQFREVRGYALVTLAAVVATLILFRLLRQRPSVTMLPWLALYAVAVAVAVGTHLFAVVIVPVHALVVIGSGRPLSHWIPVWVPALGAGLLVQWPAIVDGLSTPPRYMFAPSFPLRLGANLLGGPSAAGMLVLVVLGWTVLRARPWVSWCLVGTGMIVAAAWLIGPSWLDSRFFIWLAPATSVAAGAAVARWPRLVLLAAGCIAVQLAVLAPDLTKSEVPNRIAGAFVQAAQREGLEACALGRTRAGLLAYVDDVRVIRTAGELAACEIAVEAAGPLRQPLNGPACQRFALVLTLPAKHPGAIFADHPLRPVPELIEERAQAGAGDWIATRSAPLCATS